MKNNIFNSEESIQAKSISISCVDSSEWGNLFPLLQVFKAQAATCNKGRLKIKLLATNKKKENISLKQKSKIFEMFFKSLQVAA